MEVDSSLSGELEGRIMFARVTALEGVGDGGSGAVKSDAASAGRKAHASLRICANLRA